MTVVTPVAPQVTQAVCRGGVLEPPTLVLADTDGITYTADPEGPYEAGDRVTVTATLDEAGVGWPDDLAAWGGPRRSDDGDVSGDVHLDGVCAGRLRCIR